MKEIRKNKELSQKHVGKMIGVSQVYISKIESGNINGLTINKLEKLSKVFDVNIYEMLEILIKGR